MITLLYEYDRTRIIVFAKTPRLGHVKTRLAVAIGEEVATDFHRKITRHTCQVALSSKVAPIQVWITAPDEDEFFSEFLEPSTLRFQINGDLGAKMDYAIHEAFQECGVSSVILIGCDCPALAGRHLRESAKALADGFDLILGPAEDGGYFLIAVSEPVSYLFNDIRWGSGEVLTTTRRYAAEHGLRVHELETLWDVDDYSDYIRLDRSKPGFLG